MMTTIQASGKGKSTPRDSRPDERRRRRGEEIDQLYAELSHLTSASEALSGELSELQKEIADVRAGLHKLHDRLDEEQGDSAEPDSGTRGESGTQAVRLLASQMLAAGSSREEARARLAEEFGIGDPGHVLDDIFESR